MKYLIALSIIALSTSPLMAAPKDWSDRCSPAKGNWMNAAPISCPDQGSGAGFDNNSPTEPETKDDAKV